MICLVLAVFSSSCYAFSWPSDKLLKECKHEKPSSENLTLLYERCVEYIKVNSNDKFTSNWKKKKQDRLETWLKDNSSSTTDSALMDMAYNWFVDNEKQLRNKDAEIMVEACLWFILLRENNCGFPGMIKENFTLADFRELISFLDEKIKKQAKI
jgi:hypothetical protein